MEGGRLSEINMNNEGLIYLNNNLHINAVKVALLRKLHSQSQQLTSQAQSCLDNLCLERTDQEFRAYLLKKDRVYK